VSLWFNPYQAPGGSTTTAQRHHGAEQRDDLGRQVRGFHERLADDQLGGRGQCPQDLGETRTTGSYRLNALRPQLDREGGVIILRSSPVEDKVRHASCIFLSEVPRLLYLRVQELLALELMPCVVAHLREDYVEISSLALPQQIHH